LDLGGGAEGDDPVVCRLPLVGELSTSSRESVLDVCHGASRLIKGGTLAVIDKATLVAFN
jgi:hypothetical protein